MEDASPSADGPAIERPSRQTLDAHDKAARSAALVVNTRSRRGRQLYTQARRLLQQRGMTLIAEYPVRDPGRLPEIVKEVIARGARLVVVGGGDGTISSIVDEFAYRDAVLGILPLGTANSFARTLGIPVEVDAAVEVIAAGKIVDVDLGKIDDDYFANASAFGLSSAIGRSRLGLLKRYLGRASYPIVGAVKFLSHRAFCCRLIYADRTVTVAALDVLIANGRYQGGTLAAPEASVESRDLVIKIIKGPRKWNLIKAWALTALGAKPNPAVVEVWRATDVRIEATPAQYVSIDGEIVTRTPIRAAVAPDALKLMVPQEFKERSIAPQRQRTSGEPREAGPRPAGGNDPRHPSR